MNVRLLLSVPRANQPILLRYPCISPRAEYCEAKSYSGTLASARFLYGDRTVVTVGGTDASLMVWELVEE